MHIDEVARQLAKRQAARKVRYDLGLPAGASRIAQNEGRLKLRFPDQVRLFFLHYDGLSVEDPPLEIFPVEQITYLAPQRLHFATVDRHHRLCFDVSGLNTAGQWDIVSFPDGYLVTMSMASLWSNKIWHWIDKCRPIWAPSSKEWERQ